MYDRYGFGDDATPADVFDSRNVDDEGDPAGFLSDRGYFETVLPVCTLAEDGLAELSLYPVDLRMELPRSRRGRPVLADAAVGEAILDRLRELSAPYGTEIGERDDEGRARVVL
jgi:poly-gamma-glutamate synthesis protein (capsule biosynthesis protein)